MPGRPSLALSRRYPGDCAPSSLAPLLASLLGDPSLSGAGAVAGSRAVPSLALSLLMAASLRREAFLTLWASGSRLLNCCCRPWLLGSVHTQRYSQAWTYVFNMTNIAQVRTARQLTVERGLSLQGYHRANCDKQGSSCQPHAYSLGRAAAHNACQRESLSKSKGR